MGKRGPEKQYPARLHLATTDEMTDRLRRTAKANGKTVSEYVRRLIAKALEVEHQFENDPG
jgi:predicted DNA-binding protein